jgi:hypothetical protein
MAAKKTVCTKRASPSSRLPFHHQSAANSTLGTHAKPWESEKVKLTGYENETEKQGQDYVCVD